MPNVVEINDPDRLRELHLPWQLLLPQTPQATFFQSLDWLECYWRHFGKDQQLRVLLVSSHGTPVGILPLVVRRERTRWGSCRVLTYPLQDWCTRYGPIGPNPTATLAAGLRYIRSHSHDWDLLDLRWVDRDQCDRGRTPLAMQLADCRAVERVWKSTAMVDLSQGWDKYFASRSSKHRGELRRLDRRLSEQGEIQLERFRPNGRSDSNHDPRWDLFEECLELARLSWQGGSTDGTTLSHPQVADFLRDCHGLAAQAGALDVVVLRKNERPLAFAYNYHRQGRVFGLRTGFDPQFANSGVGSVLWMRMLRDSCRLGDVAFDLGPDSPYVKKRWVTEFQEIHHYRHYRTGHGSLLRIKDWLRDLTASKTIPAGG